MFLNNLRVFDYNPSDNSPRREESVKGNEMQVTSGVSKMFQPQALGSEPVGALFAENVPMWTWLKES